MARYFALAPIFFFVACVPMGPRDGLVVISGAAPAVESPNCKIEVAAVGGEAQPQERPVSGVFRESFVVSPNRRGHRAALECGGKLVAERTFRYGRDTKIGGEVALDRPAP